MYALLGNAHGVVKPRWLPFDLVFARIPRIGNKAQLIIVRNSAVANIWDAQVEIKGFRVIGLWEPTLPPVPLFIEKVNEPDKFIFHSDNGEIFATRNFSADVPIWRKYKRLGWAVRYLNGAKK